MYRFIFSILLLCFAAIGKAQTIDGKLYTPFNNYYQWIGGKFNSNLNIPKITATTGRDTGGIRYNLIDSSVYVWTGSQWRQVGSSLDTTSLSNRINQRVRYTDTAAMLSPYIRTASNGLTKSGQDVKLGGNMTDAQTVLNFGTSRELRFDSIRSFIVGAATTNNEHLNIGQSSSMIGFGNSLNGSQVEVFSDSILLKPFQGKINIDTLASTTDTSTHKPVVYDESTKRLKYKTAWQSTDTATVVKAYVTNAEAVTITKGQVVYIFGASGDRASVKLAKNTSDTFSSKTLGIVRADIAAGQAGWITTQGQVSGINLGAYTAGDILWLDSVAGGFTKTKPVAPRHSVFVGVVERANVGNGLIYVKPQNGQELGELHDTKITSPTNNQVLAYTAANDIWENKSVTTALGYTPLNVTDTAAMLIPYVRSINAGVRWQGVDSMFAKLSVESGYHYAEEFNTITTTLTTNANLLGTRIAAEPRSGNITGIYDTLGTGVRLGTSTSASSNPLVYTGQTGFTPISFPISANDWNLFTTRVRIPTLNDGTQKFVLLVGLQSTVGINQANAYYFTYDLDGSATSSAASANWQTVTAFNNSRTFTTTSTAVAANTYTKLSILYNSRAAYFYIDGVLVATHTTNLQSAGASLGIWAQLVKTAGTTARTADVDYFTMDIKYNTPR